MTERDQRLQIVVGVDLLLDAGELHELLRELVGVHRAQRILVLQLRRQQRQERVEIAGELLRRLCSDAAFSVLLVSTVVMPFS